jgi:hypothetical protein
MFAPWGGCVLVPPDFGRFAGLHLGLLMFAPWGGCVLVPPDFGRFAGLHLGLLMFAPWGGVCWSPRISAASRACIWGC